MDSVNIGNPMVVIGLIVHSRRPYRGKCEMKERPAKPAAGGKYHHGDLRQALIDAAVATVAEEQNWSFSLREVARRAGVSHNAPYNHFAEKRDLLDAVAAVGFDTLRGAMASALEDAADASAAMLAIARAYVSFAAGNPALYRLMFGPELAGLDGVRPELAETSGAGAKAVLRDVVIRGADDGLFAVSVRDERSIVLAILSVWSAVHGLSMLIVDGKTDEAADPEALANSVMSHVLEGLRRR